MEYESKKAIDPGHLMKMNLIMNSQHTLNRYSYSKFLHLTGNQLCHFCVTKGRHTTN